MNSLAAYNDYRDYLRQEWINRHSRNHHYSLRAFARDLDLGPGRLSNLMNGKAGLSKKAAQEISQKLGLNPLECDFFITLVEKTARGMKVRKNASERLDQMLTQFSQSELSQDHFKMISDWYHLAILQLLKMKRYRDDLKWIAETLNLQVTEVTEAMNRLERLGLVTQEGGVRKVSFKNVRGPDSEVSSDAVKQFHEQMLNKALSAIFLKTPETRDLNAIVFPCSRDKLPEIREKIREFSTSIAKTYSNVDGDEVFNLSSQLFGLTQNLT